eukprot:TRINITY_DN80967_c0_g1_i1.p1 TRINITY_DN80967_c0_g1~~TRINITY_DN80967_c0_g1_i1.p1  ORF type:complete len:513 (-),score=85.30 TRINITY_DN80967_c0_g1_i1:89-1627(-)
MVRLIVKNTFVTVQNDATDSEDEPEVQEKTELSGVHRRFGSSGSLRSAASPRSRSLEAASPRARSPEATQFVEQMANLTTLWETMSPSRSRAASGGFSPTGARSPGAQSPGQGRGRTCQDGYPSGADSLSKDPSQLEVKQLQQKLMEVCQPRDRDASVISEVSTTDVQFRQPWGLSGMIHASSMPSMPHVNSSSSMVSMGYDTGSEAAHSVTGAGFQRNWSNSASDHRFADHSDEVSSLGGGSDGRFDYFDEAGHGDDLDFEMELTIEEEPKERNTEWANPNKPVQRRCRSPGKREVKTELRAGQTKAPKENGSKKAPKSKGDPPATAGSSSPREGGGDRRKADKNDKKEAEQPWRRSQNECRHSLVPKHVNLAEEFANSDHTRPPTTLMIRNIPNRYTQRELIMELEDLGFGGQFDFLYIPLDKGTMSNVGYAFVNFTIPGDAARCMQVFQNYRFKRHRKMSGKIAAISVAHVQGLEANLAHYENAAVNTAKLKQRRPVVMANISSALVES